MSARPPLAVAKHDPNAGLQGPWTVEFELENGDTMLGPATVITVMSDGSDEPLVEAETPLIISSIALDQISETPNLWGVSFTTEDGTAQTYWLRAAGQRTDGVTTYGVHKTVRLVCGHN